jgi:hypothetical protein
VLNYLGNYTHRVAISNHRILKLENDHVHFRYRDRKIKESKVMVLHAQEFLRRFLLHVLPPKFVRMRHYGILGSRKKQSQLEKCRTILMPKPAAAPMASSPADTSTAAASPSSQLAREDWKEWLKEKTGVDLNRCRHCGAQSMQTTQVLESKIRTRTRVRIFWKTDFGTPRSSRARDAPPPKDSS